MSDEHDPSVYWDPETTAWGWKCTCCGEVGEHGYGSNDQAVAAVHRHVDSAVSP